MNTTNFSQSLTLKALIIAVLTLLSLIPNAMIMVLIHEREDRSTETIRKINEKWGPEQTIGGPVLTIPYISYSSDAQSKTAQMHQLHFTPEDLKMQVQLFPEERHYGIYKTILYKSEIKITGKFASIKDLPKTVDFDKSYLSLGLSDLRGLTNQLIFKVNGKEYATEAGTASMNRMKILNAPLHDGITKIAEESAEFECTLNLNGSGSINFIPMGSTTKVEVEGDWKTPGFIGNFSPEYSLTETGFKASWSILSFNRNIPDSWTDNDFPEFDDSSFGVNLVNTVDHYQQTERSAKYSIMFIVLTFVVFFFVEILSKKRIHPIQYLLVGFALILFYSLLLSLSEQIGFLTAYIIAAIATIALIVSYSYSIFKSKPETIILTLILSLLYSFLYVILQLEDIALLIGSIGLFIILGIIMFISQKIKWYKAEEE